LQARHFKEKLLESLIIRHTTASKSAYARTRGSSPTIGNQTKTVLLDPQYRDRIRGKSLLVVDDFVTEGNSLECARNLLLNAGAAEVFGVAIGKYGSGYDVHTLKAGVRWNSFAKSNIGEEDFVQVRHSCTSDREALAEFVAQLPS
jgi:hypoxanthine phosphoribosyltransferase